MNIVANASKISLIPFILSYILSRFEGTYTDPKYKIEKIVQLIVIFMNSSLMLS